MNGEPTIKDILEIVEFIRDNGTTKDDLTRFATKDDLIEMKNEFLSHVDGFIKLHETLDTELPSLRSRCDRMDEQLQQVRTHLGFQPA